MSWSLFSIGVACCVALFLLWRSFVTNLTVFEHQRSLLYRRGRFERVLAPGRHRLWKPLVHESAVVVDMRLRSVVIGGQEIPTKDQIGIKVSVIAQYQVNDVCAATHMLESYGEFMHHEVQTALRAKIAALTLNEITEAKADLGSELTQAVKAQCAEYGLDIRRLDIRDMILPANIKAATAKIVEAEKAAKAALITAREELAAARAQANTTKLLQENPLILRLKELQTLADLGKTPNNTVVFVSGSDPNRLFSREMGAQNRS
ncbi:MAG: slipin family protein [Vicinamibacteria bacterium]|nr:slipin family protein [Vicinamibacteria bacterium]